MSNVKSKYGHTVPIPSGLSGLFETAFLKNLNKLAIKLDNDFFLFKPKQCSKKLIQKYQNLKED